MYIFKSTRFKVHEFLQYNSCINLKIYYHYFKATVEKHLYFTQDSLLPG